MKLLFTGTSNWDLFLDDNGKTIWSMSKDGNKSGNSYFGDKNHIIRLIRQSTHKTHCFFDEHIPTELAREHFSGMAHHLITPERSEPWWLLRAA